MQKKRRDLIWKNQDMTILIYLDAIVCNIAGALYVQNLHKYKSAWI